VLHYLFEDHHRRDGDFSRQSRTGTHAPGP
jgi:hypothetical protein